MTISAREKYWNEPPVPVTTNDKGIYAIFLPSTWTGNVNYTLVADYDGVSAELPVKARMCISPIVYENGNYQANGSMPPSVNNLIDQNFELAIATSDEPSPERPEGALMGDYFAWPILLGGSNGALTVDDTSAFTLESDEPRHSLRDNGQSFPEARSAWFTWTAPGTGDVSFTVSSRRKIGSTTYYLHPMIAAYQGSNLATARRIALFDGFQSDDTTSVTFTARRGEEYRLVIVAYADDPCDGPYSLAWAGDLVIAESEPESRFQAMIEFDAGKPVISWSSDLGEGWIYTILGSIDLKSWEPITPDQTENWRFFKVTATRESER